MKNMKWIIGLTMLISPAVMADVSLNFRHTTAAQHTAGSGMTITYDFAIDGVGAVTLDASTTSAQANIITSVNSWDGAVGTVTDASLFGTTFQILMSSYSLTTANRSFTMDGRWNTGTIGVSGNNAGRIDGIDTDKEFLKFTLTSGSPLITLRSFSWDDVSLTGPQADARLVDGDTTVTYLNMPGTLGSLSYFGTTDTSAAGLTLGSGANALLFTSPLTTESFTHGYGLSGMTLQITAVPEPTTTGLLGLGAIATLLVRRFRNRA